MKRFALYTFISILIPFFLAADAGVKKISGFVQPKTVLVDQDTGDIFVSNNNPSMKNSGYISLLDRDGKLKDLNFIKSSSGARIGAPQDMAILGSVLYVADEAEIKAFDKKSGHFQSSISLKKEGAQLLSGLAFDPKDNLYASDMEANKVFKIEIKKQNKVSVVAHDPALGNPTDIIWYPPKAELLVTTWLTGSILGVDQKGNVKRRLTTSLGGLAGIDYDAEGNLYVSSYKRNKVYGITNRHVVNVCQDNILTPSGVAVNRKNNKLMVTSLKNNTLIISHTMIQ